MRYIKIVIVPCLVDEEGQVVVTDYTQMPYGYHHILGVFSDESHVALAHLESSVSEEKLREIAKILADGMPVEFDPDYYGKPDETT